MPGASGAVDNLEGHLEKFVILMAIGRVGSNLVVSYLTHSPKVHMVNEFTTAIRSQGKARGLSPEEISAEQKDAFERYFARQMDPVKDRLVSKPWQGAKLAVNSFVEPAWFASEINRLGIRIIRMRRRNLVKAAVSQIRAREFAEHSKQKYGQASWGVRKAKDILPPSHIEFAEISKLVDRSARQVAEFETFCASLTTPALDIEYSELTRDIDGTVEKVFRFLGLDPVRRPPEFVKATSDDLSEALSNFDDLIAGFRGTDYEAMVMEGRKG